MSRLVSSLLRTQTAGGIKKRKSTETQRWTQFPKSEIDSARPDSKLYSRSVLTTLVEESAVGHQLKSLQSAKQVGESKLA